MDRPPSDSGNLMLLAGILITIAFILTALTLAQVSSLERMAAAERTATITSEWRFLHDRIPANVNVSIAGDTKITTFMDVTFPALAETFRSVEASKGYDVELRLANASTIVHEREGTFHVGNAYAINGAPVRDLYSMDGRIDYTTGPKAVPWDGTDDGVIYGTCPDTGFAQCIVGVFVYVHLSDGQSTVEETMLIPADQ